VEKICSDTEVIEMLLAWGADVNAKDGGGRTPLAIAMEGGLAKRYAEILKRYGGKE
jgi:ankyrin repeat protein